MFKKPKSPSRHCDTPLDKPVSERTEHANLERPGALAHPVARGWRQHCGPAAAWRMR